MGLTFGPSLPYIWVKGPHHRRRKEQGPVYMILEGVPAPHAPLPFNHPPIPHATDWYRRQTIDMQSKTD